MFQRKRVGECLCLSLYLVIGMGVGIGMLLYMNRDLPGVQRLLAGFLLLIMLLVLLLGVIGTVFVRGEGLLGIRMRQSDVGEGRADSAALYQEEEEFWEAVRDVEERPLEEGEVRLSSERSSIESLIETLQDIDRKSGLLAESGYSNLWEEQAGGSDLQSRVLSKVSDVLVRLDEEHLACELAKAVLKWQKEPDNPTYMLKLAEQSYRYAMSLAFEPQRKKDYLEQACELMLHLLWQDNQNADLWIFMAQVRRELGELGEALKDVLCAVELQPEGPEQMQLALELAVCLQDWHVLRRLSRDDRERANFGVA